MSDSHERVAQNWRGLVFDLDVAIRATGDDPGRIREWPKLRYLLSERFPAGRDDAERWRLCRGWLESKHRLTWGEILRLPIPALVELLEAEGRPSVEDCGEFLARLISALETLRDLSQPSAAYEAVETGPNEVFLRTLPNRRLCLGSGDWLEAFQSFRDTVAALNPRDCPWRRVRKPEDPVAVIGDKPFATWIDGVLELVRRVSDVLWCVVSRDGVPLDDRVADARIWLHDYFAKSPGMDELLARLERERVATLAMLRGEADRTVVQSRTEPVRAATAEAAGKPSSKRAGAGGRPRVSAQEERRRLRILALWDKARAAGTEMTEFCRDYNERHGAESRGKLTTKALRKFASWRDMRGARKRETE
ncbi:MAG: hypothetical protein GYA33_00165 [Thermogutta sp.]|nr:hypothetical protein [Thermogutta sp.]